MTPTHGSSASGPVVHSQPSGTLTTPRLPPELIFEVLEHVPRKDLRAVALSSRELYERPLQAGLRFSMVVLWSNIRNAGFENWLERLDVVLRFAAASQRPALNIALHVLMTPSLDDAGPAALRDGMRLLSPWVLRALPNLVRLAIDFPPLASAEERAAFCAHPATKLRELALYPSHDGPVVVPPDLFGGVAPLLRRLLLVCVGEAMAAWVPVAAFAGVTHLKITEQRTPMPSMPLGRLFPALRVLVIDSHDCPGKQVINIAGLAALRHFALAGDTALLTDDSLELLRRIPVFEHIPKKPRIEHFWPASADHEELCGVAERCAGMPFLSFRPRDRDSACWRRTLCPTPDAHAFVDIPALAAHLVSLTIVESLVADFVRSPVTLGALRELLVDVSPTPDNADAFSRLGFVNPRVHCPALDQVVLFARGALVVELPADAVVELGRALGMRGCRPALLLAGCVWDDWHSTPRGTTALRHLFSSVENVDSVAELVPEYYRTCRYSGHFESHQWE